MGVGMLHVGCCCREVSVWVCRAVWVWRFCTWTRSDVVGRGGGRRREDDQRRRGGGGGGCKAMVPQILPSGMFRVEPGHQSDLGPPCRSDGAGTRRVCADGGTKLTAREGWKKATCCVTLVMSGRCSS